MSIKGLHTLANLHEGREDPHSKRKMHVSIGFAQLPDKLEFMGVFRRAYVMTPPTRREFPIGWLNGKGSLKP